MIAGLDGRSFLTDLLETMLPTLTFFLTSASHAAHPVIWISIRQAMDSHFRFFEMNVWFLHV